MFVNLSAVMLNILDEPYIHCI